MSLLIMKFGGAAVASIEKFSQIAEIIMKRKTEYQKIVVTVSAMGSMTDELIAMAKQVNENPPGRELDMLLSVGERVSVALLSMALARIGIVSVSLTGSQSGIITSSDHTEAKVVDVKTHRLKRHLDDGRIPIVAGFQGMSLAGEITTLGRGGTDLTAVALGCALNADCVEFYKDVLGVFDKDPKIFSDARLLPRMDYTEAIELMETGAKVLQSRCVRLAQKNNISLRVLSFSKSDSDSGTRIEDKFGQQPLSPVFEE
jgi:aspartate kinase